MSKVVCVLVVLVVIRLVLFSVLRFNFRVAGSMVWLGRSCRSCSIWMVSSFSCSFIKMGFLFRVSYMVSIRDL